MMKSVVYDLESYPNVFLCTACSLDNPDEMYVWEISDRRDDGLGLHHWLYQLGMYDVPMIGYNNIGYDYHLIHAFVTQPSITADRLYAVTESIIGSDWGQGPVIWPSDRLIPQIDLYKIHHFDNKAKRQSLKGLEVNMRSKSVEDLPFPPGTYLTSEQIDKLIEYNKHDVLETHKFAQITMPNIKLRQDMLDNKMLSGDVLNFNDTKLGKELLIQRLGRNLTHDANGPRQTIRTHIPLRDVVFPYIQFQLPEFKRVHQWMLEQTLMPQDFDGVERASTKGVFTDVNATIDGFTFHFGTGGIHGSIERSTVRSDDTHVIVDCDIASLYPSIAIVNQLAPEHLGNSFVAEYARLREERFKYPKGSPENAALKLALNGSYGASNDIYSPLYDPLFTMKVTINGQLMLCMLAELLIMNVPDFKMISINTDGITAILPRTSRSIYNDLCKQWEKFTCLDLEFAEYSRIFIRDVNSYIAEYA